MNTPRKPPLRTVSELAQEFGLSRYQLAYYIGRDVNSPKPVMKRTGAGAKNTWYSPAEMRAWWKGKCAPLKAESEAETGCREKEHGENCDAAFKRTLRFYTKRAC